MGKFAVKAREEDATRNSCIVGRALAGFDDEDMAEFLRLSRERKWHVIGKVVEISPAALRKHANGLCTCPAGSPGHKVLG